MVLAWLIAAAGWTPYVEVWAFAPWQMWVPNLVMPFACLLVAFGVGAANPLSFGGRAAARFDPERRGLAGNFAPSAAAGAGPAGRLSSDQRPY